MLPHTQTEIPVVVLRSGEEGGNLYSGAGHIGDSHVVLCREVVLFLEVQNGFEECPL